MRTKHDHLPADVGHTYIKSNSERESEEGTYITHPTSYHSGATLFSLDNWDDLQELTDQDMLREITRDYWIEYKGWGDVSTSSIDCTLDKACYCCQVWKYMTTLEFSLVSLHL